MFNEKLQKTFGKKNNRYFFVITCFNDIKNINVHKNYHFELYLAIFYTELCKL